jgi:uncharacterized protein (DUF983 family)
MNKGSKFYSIFRFKCPRCHSGDVFTRKSIYSFRGTNEMLDSCSVCNLNYQPETGFYFGASYVSYALTVLIAILITIGLLPFVSWRNEWVYIGSIASGIFLSLPMSIRLSRIIWLNFFFRYKTPEQLANSDDKDLDFSSIQRQAKRKS